MRTLLFVVVIFFCCCKGSSTKSEEVSGDSTKYFQVREYIESQVKEVTSTPYYIYKLVINGSKKDSTSITTKEVMELSKKFTEPDINDSKIKKNYSESVFFDETTKSYSISYSTTNKDLTLQSIDVLLKDDGKTVKRIFIRKFYNYPDSSAIEQLSWKPNESFEINRLVQQPSKQEIASQTVVVWNAKDKEL